MFIGFTEVHKELLTERIFHQFENAHSVEKFILDGEGGEGVEVDAEGYGKGILYRGTYVYQNVLNGFPGYDRRRRVRWFVPHDYKAAMAHMRSIKFH
jgi:hypothetical protein